MDISGNDIIAPSKVVDLGIVMNGNVSWIVTFTEPGDDLDSDDPVTSYTIRYTQNMTSQNFESDGKILEQEDLYIGNLCPGVSGQVKELQIK